MSIARKTNAKYGAKIPTAPSTGAKQAQAAKQGKPADLAAKVNEVAKKGGDKKR